MTAGLRLELICYVSTCHVVITVPSFNAVNSLSWYCNWAYLVLVGKLHMSSDRVPVQEDKCLDNP